MNLKELIEVLPNLLTYFIPGAITLAICDFVFLNKQDHSTFLFWSVIVSYITKILTDACVTTQFNNVIYLVACAIIPFVLYGLKRIGVIDWILSFFRLSDIRNIWLSTLDLEGCNYVILHLSDGTKYRGLIESADNNWVILADFDEMNQPVQKEVQNATASDEPCQKIVCIPMTKVERFEMTYDDGSKMFKKFYSEK